jgi:hypothetical protein
MAKLKPSPVVVVEVSCLGVEALQVHARPGDESEGMALIQVVLAQVPALTEAIRAGVAAADRRSGQ